MSTPAHPSPATTKRYRIKYRAPFQIKEGYRVVDADGKHLCEVGSHPDKWSQRDTAIAQWICDQLNPKEPR